MNKYTIITGYFAGQTDMMTAERAAKMPDFFHLWLENTRKYSEPTDIFVINNGSTIMPYRGTFGNSIGKWIDLSYNFGHVHTLDHNDNPNKRFCGWSLTFIMGCMLCYSNNTDMIFKEQDCLAFGDWTKRLYEDLGTKKMLVGKKEDANGQGLEQSLMLIKHDFLMPFCLNFMALNYNDAGAGFVRPEMKFRMLMEQLFSNEMGFMTIGYGRNPAINFDDKEFYVQQISVPTMEELFKRKLVGLCSK